ncbi:MAG: anti-sigma B factor antagonist [Lysobacteraceae bacterium]
MSIDCTIVRADETLRFEGLLHRDAIAALWPRIPDDLQGVRRFDLGAVASIDSAGLALVSLLAARCGTVEIEGSPEGFAELRAAYRLGHGLAFVRD